MLAVISRNDACPHGAGHHVDGVAGVAVPAAFVVDRVPELLTSFSDTTVPLPEGFMEAMTAENRAQNDNVSHGCYSADTVENENVSHGCYLADTTYPEDE